jgi:cell division protein FtsB
MNIKLAFLILVVCLSFLGCSGQAQLEETNQQLQQQVNEMQTELNNCKEKLAIYENLEVDSIDITDLGPELVRLQQENVNLKQTNDSLIDVIYKLENPESEGSVSHPDITIQQIK